MIYKALFSKNYIFLILLFSTFLGSFSSTLLAQYVDPPATPKVVEEAAEAEAETSAAAGGMQIPIDGSSLEAFEASLARIKESASEADYITLENAIQWLLVYDLSAGNDKAKLAKNLDGLTGDEVINRVGW